MEKYFPKEFGLVLILLGIAGLFATAVVSFTKYAGLDAGTLPAVSFLTIILGMSFAFPSMLEEGKNEISTMRVVLFTVVLVFATLYIKLGWIAGTFEQFKIDSSWIYILGLAFGSKAVQKFGEDEKETPVLLKKKKEEE